ITDTNFIAGPFGAINQIRSLIAGVLNQPPQPTSGFSLLAANETGIQGRQMLALDSGQAGENNPPAPPGPTVGATEGAGTEVLPGNELNAETKETETGNNAGNRGPQILKLGNKFTPGSNGAAASKPGQRLQAAFEGTADRIDKAFNDVRDGIDKTLKGLSGRGDDDGADAGGSPAGASTGEAEGS
ncbi:MAG: hypothetical protein ACRDU5_12500, partial [Mycobacterium sp.]